MYLLVFLSKELFNKKHEEILQLQMKFSLSQVQYLIGQAWGKCKMIKF